MRRVQFSVPGAPVPQGSKRIGRNRATGQPVLISVNDSELKKWRKVIAEAAEKACEEPFPDAMPVTVDLLFALPRPKSLPKRAMYPSKQRTGDIDKLARAVLDGLTGPVLHDDAQVVTLKAQKHFATSLVPQGVLVTVTETV